MNYYIADTHFGHDNIRCQVHSDNSLQNKTKKELIEYIRTIEQNWINAEDANTVQYENYKKLLAEERSKAIDELADALILLSDDREFMKKLNKYPATTILEVAEDVKNEVINK